MFNSTPSEWYVMNLIPNIQLTGFLGSLLSSTPVSYFAQSEPTVPIVPFGTNSPKDRPTPPEERSPHRSCRSAELPIADCRLALCATALLALSVPTSS